MNRKNLFALTAALLLTAGCAHHLDAPVAPLPGDLDRAAHQLAKTRIIVDTHIDVPYRVTHSPADVSAATEDGDFDYPRAVAGGLNAAFMSIYTAADLETSGGSKDAAESLIDWVEALVAASPDKFG